MRVHRFHVDSAFSDMKVIDLTTNATVFTEKYLIEKGSKKPVKDVESREGFLIEWRIKAPSPSIFLDFMLTSFVKRSDQEANRCPELFYISCDAGANSSSFDDRCIKELLVCDDENNCGNSVDESRCRESETPFANRLSVTRVTPSFQIKYRFP